MVYHYGSETFPSPGLGMLTNRRKKNAIIAVNFSMCQLLNALRFFESILTPLTKNTNVGFPSSLSHAKTYPNTEIVDTWADQWV